MSKKYLLEIGTEEIPARFVKDTLNQLKSKFEELFREENINYESIEVYSTPRRLSAIINGLDEKQEDEKLEIRGPSKEISFDEDDNPTKALEGFMRGQNIELKDIIIKDVKGTDYVFANIVKKGKNIEDILSENMEELIKSIRFSESMMWGGKNLRFIRPIRWIVSLFNDEILKFEFEGIKVSNETNGHRFLGDKNIKIDKIDNYETLLKENYVILKNEDRQDIIERQINSLAKEKGGHIEKDKSLLYEVTNIVEYPTAIIGKIKEEYLTMPDDVIITPMKEHQRYFPIFDKNEELLPYFITIRNGDENYVENVVKGNEKVIGARLEDAKFFYEDDISKPLEDYVEELENITFQDKLGTMYDKTKRVQKLSNKIGEYLNVASETLEDVDRAAYLSKADLATQMVVEFTELQGNIGMEYSKESGENEIVSLAIYEQYLPRFAGDSLPTTTAGTVLSIADKLDSIAGLFAIGIHPTGSQDPFGLRRNAIGIINILLEHQLNVSLGDLIDYSLYIYVDETGLSFNYDEVKDDIIKFFMARVKNMFSQSGIKSDIIDSVISTGSDNIYDLSIRTKAVKDWVENEEIDEVLSAFNRVATLAKNAETEDIDESLFGEYEKDLFNSYMEIEKDVIDKINNKNYKESLDMFTSLRVPIDNFFDNVMVMVDDEKLKNNRLALIKRIYDTMIKVCDLSKIVS